MFFYIKQKQSTLNDEQISHRYNNYAVFFDEEIMNNCRKAETLYLQSYKYFHKFNNTLMNNESFVINMENIDVEYILNVCDFYCYDGQFDKAVDGYRVLRKIFKKMLKSKMSKKVQQNIPVLTNFMVGSVVNVECIVKLLRDMKMRIEMGLYIIRTLKEIENKKIDESKHPLNCFGYSFYKKHRLMGICHHCSQNENKLAIHVEVYVNTIVSHIQSYMNEEK